MRNVEDGEGEKYLENKNNKAPVLTERSLEGSGTQSTSACQIYECTGYVHSSCKTDPGLHTNRSTMEF